MIQEGVFNGGITETKIPQSLFESTPDNIFNIHFSDLSTKIIQKIDSLDNKYLKDNTLFVLGIVTGDNKKYLSLKKLSKDYEPIVVGKDLRKFQIDFGGNYFIYDKKVLQQIAPRDYYERPEKLIYKFIGKNYILGVLNSDLIQFYYAKSFFTIRVLRSNLERLPIFNATEAQQDKVISLVEKLEKEKDEKYNELLKELNDYIFSLYQINDQQKIYIREELQKL
ncbi:MAG: RNA methylase [Parcubacteria group bacterium GW2011_GWA1_40_21]|nr:MAG: RNA methylase [Parcubacteria group bacterium GW2011_GWA1_40_21]